LLDIQGIAESGHECPSFGTLRLGKLKWPAGLLDLRKEYSKSFLSTNPFSRGHDFNWKMPFFEYIFHRLPSPNSASRMIQVVSNKIMVLQRAICLLVKDLSFLS